MYAYIWPYRESTQNSYSLLVYSERKFLWSWILAIVGKRHKKNNGKPKAISMNYIASYETNCTKHSRPTFLRQIYVHKNRIYFNRTESNGKQQN